MCRLYLCRPTRTCTKGHCLHSTHLQTYIDNGTYTTHRYTYIHNLTVTHNKLTDTYVCTTSQYSRTNTQIHMYAQPVTHNKHRESTVRQDTHRHQHTQKLRKRCCDFMHSLYCKLAIEYYCYLYDKLLYIIIVCIL